MKSLKLILAIVLLVSTISCTSDVPVGDTAIIPQPSKMEVTEGHYTIDGSTTIGIADEALRPAAEFLQSVILKATGESVSIAKIGDIMLSLDTNIDNKEGYTLSVNNDGIKILGGGYGGVIYGIESLRQLLPMQAELEGGATAMGVAFVEVEDAPYYAWRGYMLDVSRHFYTPAEVKEFLDMMAYYKLNLFHWHITDDQGWRIEIKQYPLLTENGAWRELNRHDRACQELEISKEDSDYKLDAAKMKINGTDTLYGGYYTQEEIKDIVSYAKQLNIDVLPEVDMPGHFLSGVENYDGVACFNETGWGKLFSSPVCPGKESALEFCKNIYKEVFELFPFGYVHLGADEVDKSNWERCPDCQSRMREHGLEDEKELQAWFVKYMEQYFNENGKKLIGWDEIHEGGLSESATIMWWRNWVPTSILEATKQGNNVISSPNATLYFDMQQGKNSLKKTYNHNAVLDGMSEEQAKLILGIQANLWAEYIPNMARAEFMTYPRMLALSEAAWINPADKNWELFEDKVVSHLQKMDVMGINYRPLDLEGFHNSNTFTAPTEFKVSTPQKGVKIFYTTDGSTPTASSTEYTKPIFVEETTAFKFRTYRPDGTAAEIVETTVRIEDYAAAIDSSNLKLNDGLKVSWYDYRGSKCADIATAKLKKEFTTKSVCIPEGAKGNVGLIFEGYFDAPTDDVYTFKLLSDDGSMLYLNGEVIVDNDGAHGPREKIGQKALAKGLHTLNAKYFDHNGGTLRLVVCDSKGSVIDSIYRY